MEETTTNTTPSSPEVALGVACCAGAFDPPAATSVDTTAGEQKQNNDNDKQKERQGGADANANNEPKYTKEDLIELIRAVKFSNPDASIRNVHNEIQTKMSKNESFEFLENVKLNDVKKVWKKAISGVGSNINSNSNSNSGSISSSTSKNKQDNTANANTNANNTNANANENENDSILHEMNLKKSKDGILKFYTVGDGSVKTLAKSYTLQAANAALAAASQEKDKNVNGEEEEEEDMKKYVNCFLDVPADCSGGKPHQALINFNDNKKKKSKKGDTRGGGGDGREIVKIQVAAPMPGMENSPMLLYNIDRTARTFIHDDVDDENKGYNKIKQMVNTHGVGGALKGGGSKAYFYSRITRREGDQDLISIDVSELAPAQKW